MRNLIDDTRRRRSFLRWLKGTPNRTFMVYPISIVAVEYMIQGQTLNVRPLGAILMVWGILQFTLVRPYRFKRGGGGPGMDAPPQRLVTDGPYRYLRNPMYISHLIFMLGLAITFSSWLALALFVFHLGWFHRRVVRDEAHLERLFGTTYLEYKAGVKRWIPWVL